MGEGGNVYSICNILERVFDELIFFFFLLVKYLIINSFIYTSPSPPPINIYVEIF